MIWLAALVAWVIAMELIVAFMMGASGRFR